MKASRVFIVAAVTGACVPLLLLGAEALAYPVLAIHQRLSLVLWPSFVFLIPVVDESLLDPEVIWIPAMSIAVNVIYYVLLGIGIVSVRGFVSWARRAAV